MISIKFGVLIIVFFKTLNSIAQTGWIQQNSGTNSNLYSVQFKNSFTGWCVGDGGKILKTTNGGINWIQQSSGVQTNLHSTRFTSLNTGFVAGDSGLIMKSINGGENWFRLALTAECNFLSVFFVNESIGFCGGFPIGSEPTKLFRTTNGGNTWDSTFSADYFFSIYFLNSMTGWVTTGASVISTEFLSKTSNGGFNWVFQFSGSPPVRHVFFIDSLNGWVSGRSMVAVPTIWRTTDGGSTWNTSFPGVGLLAHSINFINKDKGWASGENGLIDATTDGGINWSLQTPYIPGLTYRSVFFTDSLTGWVVGDSGRILKTTTGGVITNFSNYNSVVPEQFSLSQNYPNPFNPITNLEFGMSELGFVSLKVYDILGNEIALIVNEEKNAGTYEVEFDGSNYPSGIYFYSLTVDGNTIDTKRMILLK